MATVNHPDARPATRDDLMNEYLKTWFEWRTRYGLRDPCMGELLAAINAETERSEISTDTRSRLRSLARLIDAELRSSQARVA